MPIIDITNKCNLKCTYCCRGDLGPKQAIELSPEEILKCIQQFIEVRGRFIVLQGGEPLLHKNIVEILNGISQFRKKKYSSYLEEIKELIEQKMFGQHFSNKYRSILSNCGSPLFYISSNGMIYHPKIHQAIRKADCILEISLDSVDPNINRITRVGADMQTICRNIRKYADDVPVSIACTITEANVSHLTEMVSVASEMGCVSLKLSPVVAIGKRKETFSKFINEYYKSLIQVADELKKTGYQIFINIKTFETLRNSEEDEKVFSLLNQVPNVLIERHRCNAIHSQTNMYVDPELNVFGCASMKNLSHLCLGNLRDNTLQEILTCEKTKTIMNLLKACEKQGGCTVENM